MKRDAPFRVGIILAALLVSSILALLLSTRCSPTDDFAINNKSTYRAKSVPTNSNPQIAQDEIPIKTDDARQLPRVSESVSNALDAPIVFYGKVIDQHGNPVPNAVVRYTALDKFAGAGSNYKGLSDESGIFGIVDINGARLSVSVRKNGYYPIHNLSNQSFAYSVSADGYFKPPPTKNNPAIFHLHKADQQDAELAHVSSRQLIVPTNGIPVKLLFGNGLHVSIRYEQGAQLGEKFDWRFELQVEGGGLIRREREFDFLAPESGYSPTLTVESDAESSQWTKRKEEEFFVKFQNDTYGRIALRFYPGNRNFVVFESVANLEKDNRNLEAGQN